jgi:hypothetical protein
MADTVQQQRSTTSRGTESVPSGKLRAVAAERGTSQRGTQPRPGAPGTKHELSVGDLVDLGVYKMGANTRVTSQGEPVQVSDYDFGLDMYGQFVTLHFVQGVGMSLYYSAAETAARSAFTTANAARLSATARALVLERMITKEGTVRVSGTVARQLATERVNIPSLTIVQAVRSGVRSRDPQGRVGHFMYRAVADRGNSRGVLEVLVYEPTGEIRHVMFERLFKH